MIDHTKTIEALTLEIDRLNAVNSQLLARAEAAKKRLGDAKAIHSQWYEMPKYLADTFAADNMNNIEQIIYSATCYLDGVPGLYLPALSTITTGEENDRT